MAQRGRCRYADPRSKCHCACDNAEHGMKGFARFLRVLNGAVEWSSSEHAWNAYLAFLDWNKTQAKAR